MKKKLVMRVASFALCVVFTGMLFGAPRTKAVAVEAAAVSIGAAVLGSYLIATNMDLIGDTAETISNGITSLANDFCKSISYSGSGEDWLSALGSGAVITSPGMILLQKLHAREVGQFVDWLTDTFGLDEDGEEAVVVPGISELYSYGRHAHSCPPLPEYDETIFSFPIFFDASGLTLMISSELPYCKDGVIYLSDRLLYRIVSNSDSIYWNYVRTDTGVAGWNLSAFCWSPCDVLDEDGTVVLSGNVPVPVGDVTGQLGVTRGAGFTNIANKAEEADELTISTGLADALTLEDFATMVPAQIATGQLTSTAELTQTGEGTNPEPDTDDEAVYPYFPVLSGIRDRLDNLGDSIVDGIMDGLASLFVPSEAYLEALPQQITDTFEARTGFLTYPFSLLPEFVDRLSDTSSDWILSWPQIVEPFTNTVLFQRGSFNVSSFIRSDAELKMLYELYQLIAKVLMSFGFLGLCYNKYCSVIGDRYGGA